MRRDATYNGAHRGSSQKRDRHRDGNMPSGRGNMTTKRCGPRGRDNRRAPRRLQGLRTHHWVGRREGRLCTSGPNSGTDSVPGWRAASATAHTTRASDEAARRTHALRPEKHTRLRRRGIEVCLRQSGTQRQHTDHGRQKHTARNAARHSRGVIITRRKTLDRAGRASHKEEIPLGTNDAPALLGRRTDQCRRRGAETHGRGSHGKARQGRAIVADAAVALPVPHGAGPPAGAAEGPLRTAWRHRCSTAKRAPEGGGDAQGRGFPPGKGGPGQGGHRRQRQPRRIHAAQWKLRDGRGRAHRQRERRRGDRGEGERRALAKSTRPPTGRDHAPPERIAAALEAGSEQKRPTREGRLCPCSRRAAAAIRDVAITA